MVSQSIYPPGDKIQKAVREFSELIQEKSEMSRSEILQKIVIKYDLSPKESDFLQRHLRDEN